MWFPSRQDLLMRAMMAGYGKSPEREATPEEIRAKAQQDAFTAALTKGGLGSGSGLGGSGKCRCRCPYCGGSR